MFSMFLKDSGNPKVASSPTFNENGMSPTNSAGVSRVLYENILVPANVDPSYTDTSP